jgi:hypothetical protein
LLTYLKLSDFDRALLFNFNSIPLKSGIRRMDKSTSLPVLPVFQAVPAAE